MGKDHVPEATLMTLEKEWTDLKEQSPLRTKKECVAESRFMTLEKEWADLKEQSPLKSKK